MKALLRLFDGVIALFAWIAGLATVAMMLMVVADVTGRTVFNNPITGTVEIVSNYLMVMLAFLPLALIARKRGHIFVELFTGWMPRRARTLLDALAGLVTLAYMTAFTWKAVEIAERKTAIRDAKESGTGFIEIWPSRWVVVAGFGLMTLAVLVMVVKDFRAAIRDAGYDDDDGPNDIKRAMEEGEIRL
jgi:TRAP-type C4-dicarboxylate transport system permease small subunit